MIKALRTFRVRPSLPGELQWRSDFALKLRWAWPAPTRGGGVRVWQVGGKGGAARIRDRRNRADTGLVVWAEDAVMAGEGR